MSAICEIVTNTYPTYTRADVLEALEISNPRLRAYTRTLSKLKPVGWDYSPYNRYFSHESFEVLKSFKTLLDLRGEVTAIYEIKKICKEKFKDVQNC
jgi:hypothetical protein